MAVKIIQNCACKTKISYLSIEKALLKCNNFGLCNKWYLKFVRHLIVIYSREKLI